MIGLLLVLYPIAIIPPPFRIIVRGSKFNRPRPKSDHNSLTAKAGWTIPKAIDL